jgi:hypothetical protein
MGSLRSFALALMLAPLVPSSISAAPAPQDQTATRVPLAKTAAPPGGKVVLPIYLTPGEGKEIGSVTLKIALPVKTLKFGSVELIGVAEEAGATVKTSETAGADQNVLEITIATPETGKGRRACRVAKWFARVSDVRTVAGGGGGVGASAEGGSLRRWHEIRGRGDQGTNG